MGKIKIEIDDQFLRQAAQKAGVELSEEQARDLLADNAQAIETWIAQGYALPQIGEWLIDNEDDI